MFRIARGLGAFLLVFTSLTLFASDSEISIPSYESIRNEAVDHLIESITRKTAGKSYRKVVVIYVEASDFFYDINRPYDEWIKAVELSLDSLIVDLNRMKKFLRKPSHEIPLDTSDRAEQVFLEFARILDKPPIRRSGEPSVFTLKFLIAGIEEGTDVGLSEKFLSRYAENKQILLNLLKLNDRLLKAQGYQ